NVRTPDLFSGDIHRPGTIPRNLLPGGEMGGDPASESEARRTLLGMQARECVRAEGSEGSGKDCRAGTTGGDGVFAGAIAVQSLRTGVHDRGAGRSGAGEVRRDRGGNDRATEVRQRDPVLSAGAAGRSARDSVTGGDAVGDRGR